MNKVINFFCVYILFGFDVFSQTQEVELNKTEFLPKHIIDEYTADCWFGVGEERDCTLSPNGKFATWSVYNRIDKRNTFIVASTDDHWRQKFHNEKHGVGFFTANDRNYIFPIKEGLRIVPLGGKQPSYTRYITKWKQDGSGRWLAYEKLNSTGLVIENLITGQYKMLEPLQDFTFDKSYQWLLGRTIVGNKLFLYNLISQKVYRYNNVVNYHMKDDGQTLIIQIKNDAEYILKHISIKSHKTRVVYNCYSDTEIVGYCMDNTGNNIAFTTADSMGVYSHWYYSQVRGKAVKLIDNDSRGIASNLLVGNWVRFTTDGRYLFFNLINLDDKRSETNDAVKVDIWSHSDFEFYTAQPTTSSSNYYPAVVNVNGGPTVQLLYQGNEQLEENIMGDFAMVSKRQVGDRFWEYKRDSIWLLSLINGSRKLLPCIKSAWLEFDRTGKNVNYFDTYRGRHYYQYDISTGIERKLSASVPDWTLGIENPFFRGWEENDKMVNHVIGGHVKDQNTILVYDSYDIWKIDLTGKNQAVNVTNGYGRKRKMVFRLATANTEFIPFNKMLLLTAFNEQNKDSGFYHKKINTTGDPDSLFMGSYFFAHDRKIPGNLMPDPYGTGMLPIKAANANAWIVKRESATEAPNYFFTNDLKRFKPLTDLQPQKDYNWYTTELVNFTQEDGLANQGILYKPKNFNSKKKYPILFYYYEQYSYGLNCFIPPAVSESGKPNIPWYVSRDFLVFTPDNYFQKGRRMESCLQSVAGAANQLMKRPYIDSLRMGAMGLSQGGGFTNYIITHSNLFSAAFEGCGVSDLISSSLQLAGPNGILGSRIGGAEKSNGSNMWDAPEYWVRESPVLRANEVSTPLLIMHNKKDGAVLFEQGIEMFTALRRLDKKVWLLQYDEGTHGVSGKDGLDLTIRMTQYFDHYLKGLPPPRWMTQGIPRYLKGIESRYELDPDGSCGKGCKICIEQKYNENMAAP